MAKGILKVGDKLTICGICHRQLTQEDADYDPNPCVRTGHILVTVVCVATPTTTKKEDN